MKRKNDATVVNLVNNYHRERVKQLTTFECCDSKDGTCRHEKSQNEKEIKLNQKPNKLDILEDYKMKV